MAEILIEYRTIGNSVRVAAIDAETGFEVSVMGPTRAGLHALRRLAVRKLRYMQRCQAEQAAPPRTGQLA